MLSEKEMEDQIASHPERFLGERQLSVVARQFRIGGYIFDLLFEDRHGGKLIVELQKGTLDRNHTYKILDYYDEYRENNPHEFIDVMVVANQITSERKKRLHALGVEFRELPEQLFDQVRVKQQNEMKPVSEESYLSPATTTVLSPDDLVNKLIEIGYVARQNRGSQSLFVNLGGPESPINNHVENFKGLILLNPKMDIAFGTCNIEKILHFRDLLMVNNGKDWKRRAGVPGDGKRVTLDFDLEEKQTSGRNRIICRTQNGEIYLDGHVGQLPLHDGLYKWEEVQQFQKQVTSTTQDVPAARPELVIAWETAFPKADLKFVNKHLSFCSDLRNRILMLDNNIREKFGIDHLAFFDGKRCFFAIHPQSSKVTLAPLTLEISDVKDMELTEQVRNISARKYKLGGLFRVDFSDTNNADKINVAFELAKRAFYSEQAFETWNLRSTLKS